MGLFLFSSRLLLDFFVKLGTKTGEKKLLVGCDLEWIGLNEDVKVYVVKRLIDTWLKYRQSSSVI